MLTRFRSPVHARHARILRRIEPLHRLFQTSLGILAAQHPAVVDACGAPAEWSATFRPGGGLTLTGPKATYHVIPAMEGAWSPSGAPVDVVRAVDDTVDAMLRTAPTALASAKPGRDGNQLARGFYYMQRGVTESEFVGQYFSLIHADPRPPGLEDLFGVKLTG